MDSNQKIDAYIDVKTTLQASLLAFTQFFYPLLTGRPFVLSQPVGRESHFITISRELTKCARLESKRLIINVPPGYAKSTMLTFFIAWCLSKYPDCQFIYVSYSLERASDNTELARRIVQLKEYGALFNVYVRSDARGKEKWQTTAGGVVAAFGSAGSITGANAGLPFPTDRFTGCMILDDLHKPDEANSDTVRGKVITNFEETLDQRARGYAVPVIAVGQRVHEADYIEYLLSGREGHEWRTVILAARDVAGNALYPEKDPIEELAIKERTKPYVFWSQYQQTPQPAGGSLFKTDWFVTLDNEPEILTTFITCDTAETTKSYNDASVFSFWGLYKIQGTSEYGLHWLDCVELRVEPKDLEQEFYKFLHICQLHAVKPTLAAIEKKSTGVTLLSILSDLRGISIRDIERTGSAGSKCDRFVSMQPYIANKLISFTRNAKHAEMCVTHMSKITSNNTHRFDDICFVAGTLISTARGDIPIEFIKVGDSVITPFGIGIVSASGLTGISDVMDSNIGLCATPNHPVYTSDSFERLDSVHDCSKIDTISFLGLLRWRLMKLLYSMGSHTGLWGRDVIILVNQKITRKGGARKVCMLQFMNFTRSLKFLMASLFITKMAIALITVTKIWSVYRAKNILNCMLKKEVKGQIRKKNCSISLRLGRWLLSGIKAKLAEVGTEKTQEIQRIKYSMKETSSVNGVEMLLPPESREQNIAVTTVGQEDIGLKKKRPVYNITVEEYGVYYANGILVSNCDTAYDAIKIGLIDNTLKNKHAQTSSGPAVSELSQLLRKKVNSKKRSYNYG